MTVNVAIGPVMANFDNADALDFHRSENVVTSTVSQQTSVAAPSNLSPSERWGFIISATTSAVYFSVGPNPTATNNNSNNVSRWVGAGGQASGLLKKNEKVAVIKA